MRSRFKFEWLTGSLSESQLGSPLKRANEVAAMGFRFEASRLQKPYSVYIQSFGVQLML